MEIFRSAALTVFLCLAAPFLTADEQAAGSYFESIKNDPVRLRQFLYAFPKGGDLHNHLDGAIYAENYIRWAAADGKCVNLESHQISFPPCDAGGGRPPVADIAGNPDRVNQLVDAYSMRNYQRRERSGADQFFSTFFLFDAASAGRAGDMLSETSIRAQRQNIYYLELMQSWGMSSARALVSDQRAFLQAYERGDQQLERAMDEVARQAIVATDIAEQRRREMQNCGQANADRACGVDIRYMAQIIRAFPRAHVLAQTLLAVKLMELDDRYVGFNFVAREDAPNTLKDYRWQMQMAGNLLQRLPPGKRTIALHAGELALGLVPPEELGFHVREAVEVAGASRIGHGIDIIYDPDAAGLLQSMAEEGIAVEINLTSNDSILGLSGDRHPFNLYRQHQVPLTLSTDDEGVSRIDLTHEYQRAVETYDLGYTDIRQLARNALQYSFLRGQSLFDDAGQIIGFCAQENGGFDSNACDRFVQNNEKAALQRHLEQLIRDFEAGY